MGRSVGRQHDQILIFSAFFRFDELEPDWKVCLARPISLPRTLNFSRGSSREIFVKQQKETIELLFSDTNTAAQASLESLKTALGIFKQG